MTHEQIIAELTRIWHSPHLDLSLKAGLAEVIETLKEKNQSDSLVRGEVDACKESESKLDLISRADAMGAVQDHFNADGFKGYDDGQQMMDRIKALPSVEAVEGWIPCSERLPDVDVEVLATVDWPDVQIAWLKKGGTWETDEYILANDEILAWMPLPTPYKGGEDE